jgi:hypothetical protein
MIVEKKDLVQIFRSTADRYNVRITNGKGDTDIHTRLAMLKRFRDHAEAGRRCVLLAIGDHDPKGLHIVDGLHRTIMSCANIKGLDWDDPDFEVVNIGLTEAQIDAWPDADRQPGDRRRARPVGPGPPRPLQALRAGLHPPVRRLEVRGERPGGPPGQRARLLEDAINRSSRLTTRPPPGTASPPGWWPLRGPRNARATGPAN